MSECVGASWPFDLPRSGNDAITFATGPFDALVFREYDIRGRVNSEFPVRDGLNEFLVGRIGRAFGTLLHRRGIRSIAVGYDSRSYSEQLTNALVAGLLSTGREVIQIGLATTPMVYFSQHLFGGIAGACITASHNPNGWSGLKLSAIPSVTLGPEEVDQLKGLCEARGFVSGEGRYREQSITEDYVSHLAKAHPAARRMRVVVDGGNSISGPIAQMVLERAGYEVDSLNGELDWTFPHHEPDPESVSARAQVQEAVVSYGAECAFSLDGDGDRLGVTDGDGRIVWSDRVLALFARDVLTGLPGSDIVFDVKCSRVVADVIAECGGNPVMWKTGHSHIKTHMRKRGSPFAGERSGHFFFADQYYGYDDAIYAAVRLLSILSRSNQTISQLVDALPSYSGTPTMQAACADDRKYDVVEEFGEYVSRVLNPSSVIRVNGVRAEFPEGWLLVRASSNLPALVIVAEADSPAALREMYTRLRRHLDTDPSVNSHWENDPFDPSK